jgi:hypothetical protein
MCRQFFVAADEPIDTAYDPVVGEVGSIVRLPTAIRAFAKPIVYAISFQHACGCWCERPDSPLRPALVAVLEWVLQSVSEVELFTCQPGQEGSEPDRRDWCTPTELLYLREFVDRDFLTMSRDAET